jgi:hypothetical protein
MRTAVSLGLGVALLVSAAPPQARSNAFRDGFLRQKLHFGAADLRELDAGRAIVTTLDTSVRQEIAHLGVVHIDARADRFVERFSDIERFERGRGTPQIGRFSPTPRIADMASLTLPDDDVAALRACRAGDCEIKLAAAGMTRFRNEVNWSSPKAATQVNEIARHMLLELLHGYQSKGNQALGRYDDGGEPVHVAEQFRALLTNNDFWPVSVPALSTYLNSYPNERPEDVDEFFYWSLVDFGLKPTVRMNHVTIQSLSPRSVPHVPYVIAIKQLYASHYFRSALEVRFLVEGERGRSSFFLISITRSRIDGVTGFTGPLLRPLINRRSRNALRGYLEHVKRQVERPAPAAQ